jgi:hypothetical protein
MIKIIIIMRIGVGEKEEGLGRLESGRRLMGNESSSGYNKGDR